MLYTYQDYLAESKTLTMEQMETLHQDMIKEIGNDEDALELYGELLEKAAAYAAIRAQWFLISQKERMERDSGRTSCHNSVITHFNMLARYLRQQGKEALWRDRLGDLEQDPSWRKTIGDFACYLIFVNSICAR